MSHFFKVVVIVLVFLLGMQVQSFLDENNKFKASDATNQQVQQSSEQISQHELQALKTRISELQLANENLLEQVNNNKKRHPLSSQSLASTHSKEKIATDIDDGAVESTNISSSSQNLFDDVLKSYHSSQFGELFKNYDWLATKLIDADTAHALIEDEISPEELMDLDQVQNIRDFILQHRLNMLVSIDTLVCWPGGCELSIIEYEEGSWDKIYFDLERQPWWKFVLKISNSSTSTENAKLQVVAIFKSFK